MNHLLLNILHHPYDTPTFKTKALRLVSNEGRVKRLLLLYQLVLGGIVIPWKVRLLLISVRYN